MRSGKRQISQRRSVKDGSLLLDPPIKQAKMVPHPRSQSRLHLPNNPSPWIPLEVGLDCLPGSILIHRTLETRVQSLRRVRTTIARLMRLSVPHPVVTTRGGQRSAESWKVFLNTFLPLRNLYSRSLIPGTPHNHLLGPPSSDRHCQRGLFLLILRPTRIHR